MKKILVLGATGTVGIPLVAELVARGESVKAASRGARAFEGAEPVRFDYTDPSTFAPAFEGVNRIYMVMPSDSLEVEACLLPVIAFAAARGVKVVMQSVMGVAADEHNPYRKVERALEASGTPWVILGPNWFSDNFHMLWGPAVTQGELALPAGEGASSFIDARDIAASAAAALTTDRFDGQAFTLTGPQALGYREAAALLSRVAGRPIRYTPISDDAFVAMLQGVGLPEVYGRMLAGLFSAVREGATASVSEGVEVLTGRPPRSLERYASDHASALSG
ncbi:SDR family oxidoreductase [Variovorax sp. RT4R15]|uniref:SDR family oxidoreductase n=1 Tax=Variovorax sp. RT4R15 TaxID=3443737 RepID=UPI003F46C385